MIPLSLICIAALIGYRIALKEIDDYMKFYEMTALEQAKVLGLGMVCSMVIVFSFLVMVGAV